MEKWWQVALTMRTEPGMNGGQVQIIFDVEAEDREQAIVKAYDALAARAKVDFAIAEH